MVLYVFPQEDSCRQDKVIHEKNHSCVCVWGGPMDWTPGSIPRKVKLGSDIIN